MNELNEPDLTEYNRQLDEWGNNRKPCRMCDDLRDFCPLCSAEIGRILTVGLSAIGFTQIDNTGPRRLRKERN
jgi:hypothetical protein